MNRTVEGIEDVTYLRFNEVATLPPPSRRLKNTEVMLRGTGKMRCTGTAWVPADGSSSVGSLDANSPIPGNPTALNTPAKLAAAIQALQGFQQSIDGNNDGNADKTDNRRYNFVNQSVWLIEHNLNRKPEVRLFDATGRFEAAPEYLDDNRVQFTFGSPLTGYAEI